MINRRELFKLIGCTVAAATIPLPVEARQKLPAQSAPTEDEIIYAVQSFGEYELLIDGYDLRVPLNVMESDEDSGKVRLSLSLTNGPLLIDIVINRIWPKDARPLIEKCRARRTAKLGWTMDEMYVDGLKIDSLTTVDRTPLIDVTSFEDLPQHRYIRGRW